MQEEQMKVADFHVKHGFAVSEKLHAESTEATTALARVAESLDAHAGALLTKVRGTTAAGYHFLRLERAQLIVEETAEVCDALMKTDKVLLADALADLAYVVIGTAVAYGIPLQSVFNEVHRSNMTKPKTGETLLKGPASKALGYEPPRILDAMEGRL